MPVDPRQSAVECVVREMFADARRFVAPGVVMARGVERLMKIIDSDERPAERYRRENDAALREMAARGNSRDSARQVARLFSSDPHTREMYAQRFRELRRKKLKRIGCV
jgi:hypothetical protein